MEALASRICGETAVAHACNDICHSSPHVTIPFFVTLLPVFGEWAVRYDRAALVAEPQCRSAMTRGEVRYPRYIRTISRLLAGLVAVAVMMMMMSLGVR